MATAVLLGVTEDGADEGRLEELSLRLREELLALAVQSVEPRRDGEAPEGTRAGAAEIAGALVVSLQPTVQLVGAMIAVVRNWLRRRGAQTTVRIEIGGDVLELSGADSQTQQRLVDHWIAEHSTG
ncbi:MAG: hypothetical protein ACRDTM_01265 [Micromonosporaceae bacterium]